MLIIPQQPDLGRLNLQAAVLKDFGLRFQVLKGDECRFRELTLVWPLGAPNPKPQGFDKLSIGP